MAYWLVKSEPTTYSIDRLKAEKSTVWDGVRNYAARNNLRAMKKGDQVLFYHSVTDPAIVGIATVSKEAYADPTAEGDTWSVVELTFKKKLKSPIALAAVKADKKLAGMDLLRLGRLSVQVVRPEEWEHILNLAER
ncbi:MAG: EVE domain-containing protein [Chitinophagales bacterium]